MRILYLIDTLNVGGTERSLVATLPLLADVEPIVCHLFPGQQLKPALEAARVPVHSLDLAGDYPLAVALQGVRSLARATSPDLIHAMLYRSNIVSRLIGPAIGIPVINSLVNESYSAARFENYTPVMRAKLRMVQLFDRITAPCVDHFIANSVTIKRANSAHIGIPLHRISVIYRGRDPSAFGVPDSAVLDGLRRDLRLPPNAPILLNVARLAHAKNQRALIRALPRVLREYPDTALLIAGEGRERDSLQAEIKRQRLGASARLLGNRDDVAAFLRLADLFVFPSFFEGHPGVLIEAMFATCPIVASDIPVHRETLLDGALGELVPLDNVDALARRIVHLLRNPAHARNLAACAQVSARNRFDIRTVAAQHDALYRGLLSERNAI
jgi:glycosyltransferase involved in cell wall biosynthesis